MIVHDRFPWLSHLSLGEIDERTVIRLIPASCRSNSQRVRLQVLEARSVVTPPEPEPPAAA